MLKPINPTPASKLVSFIRNGQGGKINLYRFFFSFSFLFCFMSLIQRALSPLQISIRAAEGHKVQIRSEQCLSAVTQRWKGSRRGLRFACGTDFPQWYSYMLSQVHYKVLPFFFLLSTGDFNEPLYASWFSTFIQPSHFASHFIHFRLLFRFNVRQGSLVYPEMNQYFSAPD